LAGAKPPISHRRSKVACRSSSDTSSAAGVGLEYAFTPNWSAKAEYLFVDLGNASCGFANCGGSKTTVSLNENIIRAGINFKFGGGWW
jgi:outer membrane immunogenic protein